MSAAPETGLQAGRSRALQYAFTAHIRDPENNAAPAGIEDRRMAIYRDLVYSNMESFIASNFPVIRTLYDDDQWSTLAHEFFREHQCPSFLEYGEYPYATADEIKKALRVKAEFSEMLNLMQ